MPIFVDIRLMRSLNRAKNENFTQTTVAHAREKNELTTAVESVRSRRSSAVSTTRLSFWRASIMKIIRTRSKMRPVVAERQNRPKSKKKSSRPNRRARIRTATLIATVATATPKRAATVPLKTSN